MRKKVKKVQGRGFGRVKPLVDGIRWMIVSPWQNFEETISVQRKMAWSMFRYAVEDKETSKLKAEGYRAVKCRVTTSLDPRK